MYTLKAGKCKGWTPLVMLDSLWGHSSTSSPRVGGADLPSSQRPKKSISAHCHWGFGAWKLITCHQNFHYQERTKRKQGNGRCTFLFFSPSVFNIPKLIKHPIPGCMNKAHLPHAWSKVQRPSWGKPSAFANQWKWPYHCQWGESTRAQKARREYETISTEILSTSVEKSSYRKMKKFPRSQHKSLDCILLHPSPRSPAHTQVPECQALFSLLQE